MAERGEEFESVNIIENPLSAAELKDLLNRAGLSPQQAIRTNEGSYSQFVAGKSLGDDQLIRVMADHPELVQRPIVVRGEKVVLARPVENLAKLGIKGA